MSAKRFVFNGVDTYVLDDPSFVFDPAKTFDCGQCFRWNSCSDGSFRGIAGGRALTLRRSGTSVFVKCTAGVPDAHFCVFLDRYFDVGTDYSFLETLLAEKDRVMKEAVKCSSGIRLLRQDIFETVISFIISANNNIPRIKKCIENVCFNYGNRIGDGLYAFPAPEALASADPKQLTEICKVGYRGPYIVNTAERFASGAVSEDSLMQKAPCDAAKYILGLQGVGPKVLNCIMLFTGLDRSSFPVDVWVERMMGELYGFENCDRTYLEKYGKSYFGEYAGLAQQYLFYYIRQIHCK
ncbi:MAG: hypothetical protein J6112_07715 [Clostridia bacterium]|nr:hypothetical protein [Clostridia bacterium]